MSSFFLIGYFGYNNIGDGLILETFMDQTPGKNNKFFFLSGDKSPSKMPDAIAVPRWSLIKIVSLLLDKNIILVAPGGELFQDRTSFLSLLYYASFFFLARLIRKPYYCVFQGLDLTPKFGISAKIMNSILEHAAYASIRDILPEQLRNSIYKRYFPVSADILFTAEPYYKKMKRKKTIIFALSPAASGLMDQFISLSRMLKKNGFDFQFLSMHPEKDDLINECVQKLNNFGSLVSIENGTLPDLAAIFRQATAVITTRYHAGIVSLLTETPFFMPSLDSKSRQLLQFFGRKGNFTEKVWTNMSSLEFIAYVKKDLEDDRIFKCVAKMRQKSRYIFKELLDTVKGI